MTLEDLYRLLRSGHVQSQGIVDTLDDPLVVLDQSLCVVTANPAFLRTFQVDRDATLGHPFYALGNGQWDIPELRRLLDDVIPKAAAVVGFEVSHAFPSLGRRTFSVTARRLVHPDDNSLQMLLVFQDLTHSRRREAAKDILLGEARHRMKNLLAVVTAIAMQTQTEGRSATEYRDDFLGRFRALHKAQDLSLSSGQVDVATVVSSALQAIADRARVEPGPETELEDLQVQPLMMILYELTTNAVKYGSLSVPDGIVRVSWSMVPHVGGEALLLTWREENGPKVAGPGIPGFGTRLIDHSAKDLGGAAELSFAPDGLKARITIPMA